MGEERGGGNRTDGSERGVEGGGDVLVPLVEFLLLLGFFPVAVLDRVRRRKWGERGAEKGGGVLVVFGRLRGFEYVRICIAEHKIQTGVLFPMFRLFSMFFHQ